MGVFDSRLHLNFILHRVCVVCFVHRSSLEVGIVVLVPLCCCVHHSEVFCVGELLCVFCVCYVIYSSCHSFVSRSLVLYTHHSLFEVW